MNTGPVLPADPGGGARVLDPVALADLDPFLGRLLRLDASALVRMRPAPGGHGVVLWSRLPFGVLVARTVPGHFRVDTTVRAVELQRLAGRPDGLRAAALDAARRDADWRWPLPPGAGDALERIPAAEVRRLAAAAAQTLRTAGHHGVAGRPVGERILRDALLDHVAIEVSTGDRRVRVAQRLIQGVVRMGFVPATDNGPVTVRATGGWVGLASAFGAAWHRPDGSGLPLLNPK